MINSDKIVSYYELPIGVLKIEYNGNAITSLVNTNDNEKFERADDLLIVVKLKKELDEYFIGKRKVFDLPLKFNGTKFQERVWNALLKIPYGETRTYKDIATAIGNNKASRAVGMANNKNNIIILIPCHRVIGSNGELVGYAGGLEMKEYLLNLEKKYS